MLYRFAWVLMWITFRIYFRRIDVIGLEKMDPSKPSILIANHPASFLDAMVLAVFLKRNVHFYVRGDIFRHPLALRVLTWLHMIPIFSREHGMQHVGKNHITFQRGKDLLRRGELLLIFPEGFSRRSKKSEPFKKGAARVALQTAFEDGGITDLNIQCIALHYSFHGIHSDLLIHVGEKMNLDPFCTVYAELPAKAVNELTAQMALLFERNIIHVNEDHKTNTAEDVLLFIYNECLHKKSNFLNEASAFCKRLDTKNNIEFDLYTQKVKQYNALLVKHNINDRALSCNPVHPVKLVFNVLFTVELYLFGSIFWLIPGKVAKWIADRTVTRIDFYTSVTTGVLAFLSLFWWIACTLVAFLNGWQWLTFLFVVSPLIAYSTMQWKYDFKDVIAFYNWRRLQKMHPDTAIEIAALRTDLLT